MHPVYVRQCLNLQHELCIRKLFYLCFEHVFSQTYIPILSGVYHNAQTILYRLITSHIWKRIIKTGLHRRLCSL